MKQSIPWILSWVRYCLKICVCFTGHRSEGYVWIMRWWSSNLGQRPCRNLGSMAYCYIAIIDPPRHLLPPYGVLLGGEATSCTNTPSTNVCLVSTHDHSLTQESPISVQAHQFSRASPFPVAVCNPPLPLIPLPYHVYRIPIAAAPLLLPKYLLTWPSTYFLLPPVSTMTPGYLPSSIDRLLCAYLENRP